MRSGLVLLVVLSRVFGPVAKVIILGSFANSLELSKDFRITLVVIKNVLEIKERYIRPHAIYHGKRGMFGCLGH